MNQMLTPQELKDTLKLDSVRTLDQWAYLGKGPAFVKVGRHRRYRTEDVERWLEANRRGGDAA